MGRRKNKPVPPGACAFCKDTTDDDIKFGKFPHKEDFSVHENCLFFSSGLEQTKSEEEEVFGFSVEDIKKELTRGVKLKCVFCKDNRATVGCSKQECRKTFHYPCGLQNDVLFQHYGSFRAFCKQHKPTQKKINPPAASEFVCRICFASLQDESSDKYLYTICCKNNYFHRNCLQDYAYNAGSYFFKCPLCNDSEKFSQEMQEHGIHVPIKDASWELEEHAYEDLLFRPSCGASPCKCENGTTFSGTGAWKLLNCHLCGSQARHKSCARLKAEVNTWTCKDCKSLLSECRQPPEEPTIEEPTIEEQVQSVRLEDPPVKIEASIHPSTSSLRPITNILDSSNSDTFLSEMLPKEIAVDSKVNSGLKKSSIKDLKQSRVHNHPKRNISSAQPKNKLTQPVKRSTTKIRSKTKGFWKSDGKCCSPNNPYRCIRVLFGLECRRI